MRTKTLLALICALLVPAFLHAGGVTIKRQEAYQPPAGWVDRVSKRSRFGKVFEKDSIGSGRFMAVIGIEPMHYDSAGTWKNLKAESAPDTAAGYNLSVKTGRWSVDIDTLTGAFRFLRDAGSKKGAIRFTPAFSPEDVPVEYDLSGRGIKSTYTLNSGNRLAWGYSRTSALDTTGAKGKGKGLLKNALAQVKAEIQEFTAVDANQKPVPLAATWTADSLVVVLDTAGAVYPIKVDPSITDTLLWPTASGAFGRTTPSSAAAYDIRRHAAVANFANSSDTRTGLTSTGTYQNDYRTMLSFVLDGATDATAIDSARMVVWIRSGIENNTMADTTYFVEGAWTGLPDSTKIGGFTGWTGDTTAGSFSVVEYTDRKWVLGNANPTKTAQKDTLYLTIAGKAAALTKMQNSDTLRMMALSHSQVHNRPAYALNSSYSGGNLFYYAYNQTFFRLEIFYSTGKPPGLTTLADSARSAAILVGEIDSTGGINCTARGFQWWIDGDTTTISKSGSFTAGEFQDTTGALPLSVTVSFRSFATNTNGTTYGSVRTFTTGAGGGGALTVDGRTVNTNVR